ncbi:MAG TPA: hypothetical protein VJW20_20225 [Candidatus Angelobacter sp.]|nr:hypothetical protein [Candidatus Angelobacter sp.]
MFLGFLPHFIWKLIASAFALGLAYEPQDLFDIRNLAISPNKQNTYLTPVAAAAYTYRPRNPGNYNPVHAPSFYSDEGLANKGHQWPTLKRRIMENSSLDGTFDLDSFLAGWMLFFTLGSESVTGTGPWTHTMKFLQSTNQMPVTSALVQETADVIYQLADLAIADLVLSGTSSGPLQGQFKMTGSGKKVDGSVAFPALTGPLYLFGSDTDIKIGPAAPDLTDPTQQFTLSTVVAGALAGHTAFWKVVYRNAAGATLASQEISIVVPANSVSKITAPAAFPPGVTSADVYGSNSTGTETFQGNIAAPAGNFQEPNTGFAAGAALPTATTALISIKERVKDWQVHIACDIAANRAPGGQLWGTFSKVTKQRANLTIQVHATSVDDMRTIAENDTPKEVQIITNSGAAQQLTLQFPSVLLETTQIGADAREMMWAMTAGDQAVTKPGAQEVFQAVVINNQAAYGVGA